MRKRRDLTEKGGGARRSAEQGSARGDTLLTYFEFGTLAAMLAFADAKIDVGILEVGLGGAARCRQRVRC